MGIHARYCAAVLVVLLLAACGSSISGTYAGDMGTIRFESGKAYATLLNATRELNYSTDGNKVVLQSPEGNLVLTRNADGSLDTPWGKMKKQ